MLQSLQNLHFSQDHSLELVIWIVFLEFLDGHYVSLLLPSSPVSLFLAFCTIPYCPSPIVTSSSYLFILYHQKTYQCKDDLLQESHLRLQVRSVLCQQRLSQIANRTRTDTWDVLTDSVITNRAQSLLHIRLSEQSEEEINLIAPP